MFYCILSSSYDISIKKKIGQRKINHNKKCGMGMTYLIDHLRCVLKQQVRFLEAPPPNFQNLKDLLLKSWCQIPSVTWTNPTATT